MANIECNKCGDMVDVEARTVTLPFVCKWCEEDFHTPKPLYIIQYKSPYDMGWFRSENADARGVFDDFSVASAVAAANETDNGDGLVYRVVPAGAPSESESESESEIPEDRFDLDTKLIEDLSNQLVEANNQIKSLENSLDSFCMDYSRLYKDFESIEKLYFIERDKTWWERLWA